MTHSLEQSLNAAETARLFAQFEDSRCMLLAVSGGADSTALLVLAHEWAAGRKARLCAATVDHGLRPQSRTEALRVADLCARLGVPHRILDWTGDKPERGVEEAARAARYALLDATAADFGADVLATAHTLDDQAETVLMRLAAGSGPTGLAAMRPAVKRNGVMHVRPFLSIPKQRLLASLIERGVAWTEDGMNTDPDFARPRLRAARQVLDREGLTGPRLATLARRMARMSDAIDRAVEEAWAGVRAQPGPTVLDGAALRALPEEVALRLLIRAVAEHADKHLIALAKSEELFWTVRSALAANEPATRTLGGAKIAVRNGSVTVAPAPPRRESKRA